MNELFFSKLKREVSASASSLGIYYVEAFINEYVQEVVDLGDASGFISCDSPNIRGMNIHGFNTEENETTKGIKIDLFVSDCEQREELERIGKTDVDEWFKRLKKFFDEAINSQLYEKFDISSDAYRISEYIHDNKNNIEEVNLFFFSERILNDKFSGFNRMQIDGINVRYHLWDIGRLNKLRSSTNKKEPIELQFSEKYGSPLDCLVAHFGEKSLKSYLVIIPGSILADIYNDFGARLLEQNVRSFLQAKGGVNRGIRNTILHEPEYFFSYNNGLTATASNIEIINEDGKTKITKLLDLQIVNGGQTTASLGRAKLKDKASLNNIFVQMKLSIVSDEQSEIIVPKISQYANTQNKVNLSDLSANHPFHIKIEEFSRKIWAPPTTTVLRETGWFYERSRGQYNELLASRGGQIMKAKFPKNQIFNKTDMAKYMMVWDSLEPKWPNMGAQKNFIKFSEMIIEQWKIKGFDEQINDFYFKKIVCRAIIFKITEKLILKQSWYMNGYRANIVIYTLSSISEFLRLKEMDLNYLKIWRDQDISKNMMILLINLTKVINNILTSENPNRTTSNISEWAKKDACWGNIKSRFDEIEELFTKDFCDELIDNKVKKIVEDEACLNQKINSEIKLQEKINSFGRNYWFEFKLYLESQYDLPLKDLAILDLASKSKKYLNLKQCILLDAVCQEYGEEFDKNKKINNFINN